MNLFGWVRHFGLLEIKMTTEKQPLNFKELELDIIDRLSSHIGKIGSEKGFMLVEEFVYLPVRPDENKEPRSLLCVGLVNKDDGKLHLYNLKNLIPEIDL